MTERVLMKGNEALAEAALRAGCRHYFGYPITPQTEIAAYMAKRMPEVNGTFLQAESEIAAANMVMGAAAAGVRAMTSSSSPGISLKTEAISYMAATDLPCVIVNVQRGSPGLGGIQPSQADYNQATKALGHGDFEVLVYAPAGVQEIADTVGKAFDTADRFRMPALILADGMLGQMMEPVVLTGEKPDLPEKSWAVNGTRGRRERNIVNSLVLQAEELERRILARAERHREATDTISEAESWRTEDADILLVAYGATARIVRSAVDLARDRGIRAGLLRPMTLWPYPVRQLREASRSAESLLVVEMSMGQMVNDVRLAIECSRPVHFYGRTGGVIPTPEEILAQIVRLAGGADGWN